MDHEDSPSKNQALTKHCLNPTPGKLTITNLRLPKIDPHSLNSHLYLASTASTSPTTKPTKTYPAN